MRKLLFLFSLAGAVSQAWAQDWAKEQLEKSPRHREWVTVKHGDRAVETFVAYPESRGKAPVVLVIHEIFAMSDWVQAVADEFAAAGYIAIAPDLLSGMGPNGKGTAGFAQGEATRAVSGLDADQITADLDAAADYGLNLPSASRKLYVAGFCWGGGQTFRFAANRADLASAFVFYGPPPSPELIARVKAPVYGFYAENDARIDATIPDTEKAMKAAGKTYEPVTYAGAGHGFMRAGEQPGASEANAKARTDAWERLKKLMQN